VRKLSVGCKGGGDAYGCEEGLMCGLVGAIKPSPRERAGRESELCGC